MKRIIFCVTNDLVFDQRMQRICRSLCAHGCDVALVGRLLPNSPPLTQETFTQHRLQCWFNSGKLFYAEFNIRLFMHLLFIKKFDAVCAIDLDTILPSLFAAKIKGKKLVYDAHEYFPEVPEVVHRPAVKKFWEWVERFSMKHLHAAYSVSESIANELSSKYGVHFHTIRNVSMLQSTSQNQRINNRIIYQGALNEGRGLEALIKAVKDLPVELVIAGNGDVREQLQQLAITEKVNEKVKFIGKISPEKLPEITSTAFLGFNVLEHKGKSYYYSLSNKTFDYIHAETPQLMSDFPEMRKLNEEYQIGIIVKAFTPKAIANAISLLLQDKTLWNQLHQNCAEAKMKLNWQTEEKKLLSIYEQLFG